MRLGSLNLDRPVVQSSVVFNAYIHFLQIFKILVVVGRTSVLIFGNFHHRGFLRSFYLKFQYSNYTYQYVLCPVLSTTLD